MYAEDKQAQKYIKEYKKSQVLLQANKIQMPNGRIRYRCGMEIDPVTKLLKELAPDKPEYVICEKAYLDPNYLLSH